MESNGDINTNLNGNVKFSTGYDNEGFTLNGSASTEKIDDGPIPPSYSEVVNEHAAHTKL